MNLKTYLKSINKQKGELLNIYVNETLSNGLKLSYQIDDLFIYKYPKILQAKVIKHNITFNNACNFGSTKQFKIKNYNCELDLQDYKTAKANYKKN